MHSNEQNRRLDLLLKSMRAISSSMDLEDVLEAVARTAGELLGAEQCQIQDYDSSANTVTPVAFWQRHDERPEPDSMHKVYSLDDEPEERAFLEAKKVVQQLRSDPRLAQSTRDVMDKYGDLSYLNIPLVFNDQSFGVMVLVETEYERRWSDEDVALGTALGEQAAVAIENARLYKRVQAQALTDGLTGLYNHRYFYERLEQEVARARRYGTPVSLLMIDLDDFKAFNDRHGHPAGDAVLRKVSRGAALRAAPQAGHRCAVRRRGVRRDPAEHSLQPAGNGQMEIDLRGSSGERAEAPRPATEMERERWPSASDGPSRRDAVRSRRRQGAVAPHRERRRLAVFPFRTDILRGPGRKRRRRAVQGQARRQEPRRERPAAHDASRPAPPPTGTSTSSPRTVCESLDLWSADVWTLTPEGRRTRLPRLLEPGGRRGRPELPGVVVGLAQSHDLRRLVLAGETIERHSDDAGISPADAAALRSQGLQSRIDVPLRAGRRRAGCAERRRAARRASAGRRRAASTCGRLCELAAVAAHEEARAAGWAKSAAGSCSDLVRSGQAMVVSLRVQTTIASATAQIVSLLAGIECSVVSALVEGRRQLRTCRPWAGRRGRTGRRV